jgi:hypothetical protein
MRVANNKTIELDAQKERQLGASTEARDFVRMAFECRLPRPRRPPRLG